MMSLKQTKGISKEFTLILYFDLLLWYDRKVEIYAKRGKSR